MEIDIIQYISKEALILVPVLSVIGFSIKKVPYINNWVIPIILIVLGAILGYFMIGNQGIVQGILCGAASVGFHQVKKQTKK